MTALTHHGGRVDQAALVYPDAPRPWIDLSTGINPDPWRPAADLSPDLGPLPTASALSALEHAAAAHFDVPAERVAALPGSEIGLRLLSQLPLPPPYRHVAPGYRTHGAAMNASSPIAANAVHANRGAVLLANPSNPEGRKLSADTLRSMIGDGWLIVDEAFADCYDEPSIAQEDDDRLIAFRSFGKFFGLAGVRLGFVIGPPSVVDAYRTMLGDWPVSALAIAYGVAAYSDVTWIAQTRSRLQGATAALDTLLARHDLTPIGDCPLFRLIETERPVFEVLARAGILTRPFDYNNRWVRIGLPHGEEELFRLDRALMNA